MGSSKTVLDLENSSRTKIRDLGLENVASNRFLLTTAYNEIVMPQEKLCTDCFYSCPIVLKV